MDEMQRARLAVALDRAKHGTKSRFATASGVNASSVRKWLAGESDPAFSSFAAGCALIGVSLDWIAYGTRAPALDEALLAKAIAVVRVSFEDGQLSAADQARAVHLIYMRSVEHPEAPFSRSELLRLFGLCC